MINRILTLLALPAAAAFAPTPAFRSAPRIASSLAAADAVDIAVFPDSVSYTITSGPPLGVILTEFQSTSVPELTPVVVSDVTEGQYAARLGVREGDVLIGINGVSLLEEGVGFDSVIETIQTEFDGAAGQISATFFRGSSFGRTEGFDGLVGTIVNGGDAEEVAEEVEDVSGEGGTLNLSDIFGEEEEKEQVGVGLYGYIPSGFTKDSWAKYQAKEQKKKDDQKKKNLGIMGPKGFQSRSMQSFQEAMERGEATHLLPVFNAKERIKKGELREQDIPYMQRGGSWDNSDVKGAKKKQWLSSDKDYASGGFAKSQSVSIFGEGKGLDWTGKQERGGPVQGVKLGKNYKAPTVAQIKGVATEKPKKKKMFGIF